MTRTILHRLCLPALLALLFASAAATAARAAEPAAFRVMTFNIRFDNPRDGENAWPHRKDKVASMVRLYSAEVVGLQEALRSQIDELAELLPYDWLGVGRQDGKNGGEFTPIFYRRDRLEAVDSGTFWLSDAPDTAGSRGWDAALPRIATWAKFRLKTTDGSPSEPTANAEAPFFVFNTHFDHMGLVARLESAKLLRAKVAEIAGDHPAVVIGDFNCTPESPPYQWLVGAPIAANGQPATPAGNQSTDAALPPALIDATAVSRHPHHGPTTTWNGFRALVPGRKIDHIFVHGQVQVEQHAILADHWDGRFPSDHLPVLAEIVLKKSE